MTDAPQVAQSLGVPAILLPSAPPVDRIGQSAPHPSDVAGAFAANTKKAYRVAWGKFEAWCAAVDKAPLPAAPETVRDHLADMAASGYRFSTIELRLAAICTMHRVTGTPFDRADPAIAFALKRIAREIGRAKVGRRALRTEELLAIVERIDREPRSLRGLRDRCLLLLGFASGMRRAELVDLKVNTVTWRRDGLELLLPRSKTDQEGLGRVVGVFYGERERSCPVRALKRWIEAAAITEGPIFRSIAGDTVGASALDPQTIHEMLLSRAAAAGIGTERLGWHSMRVGHVTENEARGGELASAAKQLGHRKLEQTGGYLRGNPLRRSNSSRNLGL